MSTTRGCAGNGETAFYGGVRVAVVGACYATLRVVVGADVEDSMRAVALPWVNSHLAPHLVDLELTTTPIPAGNADPAF